MTGVMGFLAQCEICPQKAILTDQVDGWVCPRCVEATAPAFAGPNVQPGDRVAVLLADGTIRTGPYNPASPNHLDPSGAERARDLLEGALAFVRRLQGDTGFGDVDVAAAEPVTPTTIPCSARVLPDDEDDYDLGQVQG